MKKIIFIAIIFVSVTKSVWGQNLPLFTQYNLNPFVVNIAAAGIEPQQQIGVSYRSQWTNYPSSPQTVTMTYQGRFNRSGIGVILFNDNTGSLSYQGISGGYNYQVPLNQDYRLSLGFAAQFLRYKLDPSEIPTANIDRSDELIQEAIVGINTLDLSLGAFLKGSNGLYVGISAPNLVKTKLGGTNNYNNFSYLTNHLFALVGYRTNGKTFQIEPSILLRKVVNTPIQAEVNTKFWVLREGFSWIFGASYRTGEQAASFLFGIQSNEAYGFFFSHDASIGSLRAFHAGSNEVMARFYF